MEFVRTISEWPKLENAILIAAFEGWNDAAESATAAVQAILEQSNASAFAEIDPEEFFVFTDTRPEVRLGEDGFRREITWPSNKFYIVPTERSEERPLILLAGTEPNLKWRTFLDGVLDVVKKCGVSEIVLLGSMSAPVPHTRPVPLRGSASEKGRLELLEELGAPRSRYQGPTGIVGAFSARASELEIPSASVWGVAPNYLAARPNWKVTLRLLTATKRLLNLNLDLAGLSERAFMFEQRVSLAVAEDVQIEAYVKNLERQFDMELDEDDEPIERDADGWSDGSPSTSDELPNASALIEKLEQELFGRPRPEDDKD